MKLKRRVPIGLIVGVFAAFQAASWAAVTGEKKLPDGAQFTVDGGTLRIQFWAQDIARVTYSAVPDLPALKSLSVVASPATARLTRQENGQAYTLATPRIQVRIDKRSGAVSFLDPAGNVLLREAAGGRAMKRATQAGIDGDSCSQSFELPPDEGIYGLGQHQTGAWDYRSAGAQGAGVTVRLAQRNTDVGVPVITSSKGYMLLWDNPAVTEISAGAPVETSESNASGRRGGGQAPPPGAGPNVVRWSSEFGKAIDYYFCYRDGTVQAAMQAYRRLTGRLP